MTIPFLLVRCIIYPVVFNTTFWGSEIAYNCITVLIGGWNYEKFIPLVFIYSGLYNVLNFIANIFSRLYPICIVIILIFWSMYLILKQIWMFGDIILSIVPPFPDFIDSGIFELLDNVKEVFGLSDETILRKLGITGELLSLYSNSMRKEALKSIFPDIPNYLLEPDKLKEILKNWKIDVDNALKKSNSEKELEPENDSGYKSNKRKSEFHEKSLKSIDVATKNCIIAKTIPIDANMSITEKAEANITNEFVKTNCYSFQIQSYIKANINELM